MRIHLWASWRESYRTTIPLAFFISAASPDFLASANFLPQALFKPYKNSNAYTLPYINEIRSTFFRQQRLSWICLFTQNVFIIKHKGGLFLLQSVSKIKQEQFYNPLMCKLWPYLKFISAISERSHSVNIEGVFSLADSGNSLFYASGMDFFVSFPAVI